MPCIQSDAFVFKTATGAVGSFTDNGGSIGFFRRGSGFTGSRSCFCRFLCLAFISHNVDHYPVRPFGARIFF